MRHRNELQVFRDILAALAAEERPLRHNELRVMARLPSPGYWRRYNFLAERGMIRVRPEHGQGGPALGISITSRGAELLRRLNGVFALIGGVEE